MKKIDWSKPLECKVEGHTEAVNHWNHDWMDVWKVEVTGNSIKVYDTRDESYPESGYYFDMDLEAGLVIDDGLGELRVWLRNKEEK